jgi:RNA polymerase subunit RPABC4/transcription elongation factor Spt4
MSAPSAIISQWCSCKRTTPHLHYSSNHDFFVKLGLICFLFVEGLSFISGMVKGSTLLYLTSNEQICYEAVTRAAGTLIAPYEGLSNAAMALEGLSLFLAIVAVSTLHSLGENKASLHKVGALGAAAALLVSLGLKGYYGVMTDQALRGLHDLVCSEYCCLRCTGMLDTATQVQQRFNAAYGFWGAASYVATSLLLVIALAALLVGAALTTKVVSTWQPTPTLSVTTVGQPEIPQATTEAVRERRFCESCGSEIPPQRIVCPKCGHKNVFALWPQEPKSSKFCRFCGAKMPRDSQFCEECGARLT